MSTTSRDENHSMRWFGDLENFQTGRRSSCSGGCVP